MTVRRPTINEIGSASAHYNLNLSSEDIDQFATVLDGALGSYDVVEDLYAQSAPDVPERTYQVPERDSNPLGAWYVRTALTTSATGPLAGRRIAIKDNVAVAGVPMMNGSRAVEGFLPSRDATVVSRLLDAGGEIAGKAVCEDLCFSGSSFTSATGPVRNPWDPTRETGGSSSGSAALLAAGEVDLAIGGDQGGSVRLPASFCGIVGHKPTFGLVPYSGAFPIERTVDHLGPMARTVADVALMLTVIAGPDGKDSRQPSHIDPVDFVAALDGGVEGLRIGLLREGFGHPNADPAVDDAVRTAARRLTEVGVTVTDISVPWHSNAFHIWNVIATDGAAYQMLDGNAYGLNVAGEYDPELMEFFADGWIAHAAEASETLKLVALCGYHGTRTLASGVYAKARNLVARARAEFDAALAQVDALVLPTTPYTAQELPIGGEDRATLIGKALGMVANTAPFDVTGHPAISVPAGLLDGLPVGMMLVGRHFEDATLLRLAHAFEQHTGGFAGAPHSASIGARR